MIVYAASCDHSSRGGKELLKVLEMTLNVEMIDPVRQGDVALSWADFRIISAILDRSLLIDKDNRIKIVSEPFANADMTKVFHIVTGVAPLQPGGDSKNQ